MTTSFAKWLEKKGEPPYRYARRLGLHDAAIYRLAGVSVKRAPTFFHTHLLERVSADTGIPVGKLYGEAMEAMKAPTMPRRYVRKQAVGK